MTQITLLPKKFTNTLNVLDRLGLMENFWAEFHRMPMLVKNRWIDMVMRSGALPRFKQGYAGEIEIVNTDRISYKIFSEGEFTRRVEEGVRPFDMKPGMLASPRAREGKNGRYIRIPFRHSVKSLRAAGVYNKARNLDRERGEAGGGARVNVSRMQRTGNFQDTNADGQIVSRAIYRPAARRLDARNLPRYRNEGKINRATKWPRGVSSPNILHGLVKAGSPRHTQYMTFRTVSEKTPQFKWIHPGFKAHPVFDKVLASTMPEIQKRLKDAMMKDLMAARMDGL
jgi:hypothetical protein